MWPDAPAATLAQLRGTLLAKLQRHFEHYAQARDASETTRFLRYFAAVGAHDDGLAAYRALARSAVEALEQDVAERLAAPPAHPLFFANVWAMALERLAVLVHQHQPVVDQLFGSDGAPAFAPKVLPALADAWTPPLLAILQAWRERRQIARVLAQAHDAKFAALDALCATPYVPGRIFGAAERKAGSTLGTPFSLTRAPTPTAPTSDEALHVDAPLTELAAFGTHYTLFSQFLRRTMGAAAHDHATAALHRALQDAWDTVFLPLQTYSLRASIQQVHTLDTPDTAARPYTSTVADDMFFALRNMLSRALSTADTHVADESMSAALALLQHDYLEVLLLRMDSCRRALNVRRLVEGPRRAAAARELRATMAVYLNTLDVSAEYVARMQTDLAQPSFLEPYFGTDEDDDGPRHAAQATVARLADLAPALRSAIQFEMEEMYGALLEQHCAALAHDARADMQYALDDAAYEEAASHHAVLHRVQAGWDALLPAFHVRARTHARTPSRSPTTRCSADSSSIASSASGSAPCSRCPSHSWALCCSTATCAPSRAISPSRRRGACATSSSGSARWPTCSTPTTTTPPSRPRGAHRHSPPPTTSTRPVSQRASHGSCPPARSSACAPASQLDHVGRRVAPLGRRAAQGALRHQIAPFGAGHSSHKPIRTTHHHQALRRIVRRHIRGLHASDVHRHALAAEMHLVSGRRTTACAPQPRRPRRPALTLRLQARGRRHAVRAAERRGQLARALLDPHPHVHTAARHSLVPSQVRHQLERIHTGRRIQHRHTRRVGQHDGPVVQVGQQLVGSGHAGAGDQLR